MKTEVFPTDDSTTRRATPPHAYELLRRLLRIALWTLVAVGAVAMALMSQFSPHQGSKLTVVRHFSSTAGSPAYPSGSLVEDPLGDIYGTTFNGGTYGRGTLFRMRSDGSRFQILHSFAGGRQDGGGASGGLVQVTGHLLLGTAVHGGASGVGVIFGINTDGTNYRLLHGFSGGPEDGATPEAGLSLGPQGRVYGTTVNGGRHAAGTVFTLNDDGTGYRVLHHFDNAAGDGTSPATCVVTGADGALYGTALFGGAFGHGTVYRLAADGSGFGVLHNFQGAPEDGENACCRLLAKGGVLYGTASGGGCYGLGTVFKLNQDGTDYVVLRHFRAGQGAFPQAGLVEGPDGRLYGVTMGGADMFGTLFRLNADGSGMHILHAFNLDTRDGTTPCAPLLVRQDGTLYGTAKEGGRDQAGTIFYVQTGHRTNLLNKLAGVWRASAPKH